ncbi:MAG: MBL fold metallo-hydrolase [Bacillota bacterium]
MGKDFELVGETKIMELFRLETEPFGTNAYIVVSKSNRESMLIDAPGNADLIKKKLRGTELQGILITHGHMDHLMALEELYNDLGVPLAAHADDAGKLPVEPDRLLQDGDTVNCGEIKLEILYLPGHTRGSICFRAENYLLSGDAIFPGGPGKTATPGDFKQALSSIQEKLLPLPDDTVILPGHGDSTTIGRERKLIETFLDRGYDENLCGDVTWENA